MDSLTFDKDPYEISSMIDAATSPLMQVPDQEAVPFLEGEKPGLTSKVAKVLKDGTGTLLDLQQDMAKLLVDVAACVQSMKGSIPVAHLRAFLATECRIPRSDVKTYLEFGEKLGPHRDVLVEAGVSLPVIKALVGASSTVREAAVARIAAGHLIGSADVSAIARDLRRKSMSENDRLLKERRATLRRLCSEAVPALVDEFELHVDAFLNEADAFVVEHLPDLVDDCDEWPDFDPRNPDYISAHAALSRFATVLLANFERLFGREHLPPSKSLSEGVYARQCEELKVGIVRTRLAEGYEALRRVSSGRFAFSGGSALRETDLGAFDSTELWDAIAYLSKSWGTNEPKVWDTREDHFKPRPLRVVELCAGAGGQAIGLEAAGFSHAALYEKGLNAFKTLRANAPGWHVVRRDISKDIVGNFSQYRGIDLLAGGLPCQPFSARGEKMGRNDARDMWPSAVSIVRTVQPRAFFFENVEGFMFRNFSEYRAEIEAEFDELKYDVEIHRINAADWGMAQSRNRIVLVGMPKGTLGRFKMPVINGQRKVGLAEAVGDLVTPYRTRSDRTVDPASPQGRYDSWASRWLSLHADDAAPTITRFRENKAAEDVSAWKSKGFDMSKIANKPTTIEEVTGDDYLPKITLAILQRLQGFPDRWQFSGADTSVSLQIANAFPPRLSQAMGLALRSALTGEDLDIPAMARSGIDDRKIGRRRRDLNGGRSRALDADEELGHPEDWQKLDT